MEFKPSIKQYQALMYLGAVPISDKKDGEWVLRLNKN